MPQALREAAAAFRRTPLLILVSVVTIGFSIFVVGLFALATFNVRRAIEGMEERVEVVAYLREDVSQAQIQLAEREIPLLPEVGSATFVSKTEALATAQREMEEFRDVFTDLEANPLPASFELRLRPGFRDPDSAERVAANLRAYPFVEDVRFGNEWLEKIVSLRRIAGGATAIIGGAFALVAAIIIGTAVRMAVSARRDEIEIMRLVGASDGFVQAPFLLEGFATGVLGGALAVALTWMIYRALSATLIPLEWLPATWLAAGMAGGALYGLLASAIAVTRQLRRV
jgi:cell division transport system permease protein